MRLFFLLAISAFSLQLAALPLTHSAASFADGDTEGLDLLHELPADASGMSAADFLNLSPEVYREKTGKKMGWMNAIKLKIAQKALKKQLKKKKRLRKKAADRGSISQGLYVVLALFGLAWIAMGVMDDWEGSTWIINLVLAILFILPGLIHALIVMSDYY